MAWGAVLFSPKSISGGLPKKLSLDHGRLDVASSTFGARSLRLPDGWMNRTIIRMTVARQGAVKAEARMKRRLGSASLESLVSAY